MTTPLTKPKWDQTKIAVDYKLLLEAISSVIEDNSRDKELPCVLKSRLLFISRYMTIMWIKSNSV